MEFSEYLARNQQAWTANAPRYAEFAVREWTSDPSWGIWGIPEAELGLLGDVTGKDVLENGCGTAYFSAWLARLGARCVVGLDPTAAQLATARAMQDQHGLHFPLVLAAGEALPFPAERFDLVVSEYGAALWADPHRWIAEAARVLRPGGELVFLTNSLLSILCSGDDPDAPVGETLARDQFGLHRVEWAGEPDVEFHLAHGDWVRLLRTAGFEVVDLVELQAPPEASGLHEYVHAEWARRWPAEEIWRARKR